MTRAMHPDLVRRIPPVAALATLIIHLIGNPHYGFFRDELYFIICGFHPAWGYVDQPPVVPLLAASTQFFGHSLFAVRALCACFAAASVYTTCLLVIELGGGAFAEGFAALVAALTPVLMDFGMKLSTDTVGLWLWPLAALYVLRIVKGADPRWWLAVGAIFGIAIESKYSVILFAVAIVVALLLLPATARTLHALVRGRRAARGRHRTAEPPVASGARIPDVDGAARSRRISKRRVNAA